MDFVKVKFEANATDENLFSIEIEYTSEKHEFRTKSTEETSEWLAIIQKHIAVS